MAEPSSARDEGGQASYEKCEHFWFTLPADSFDPELTKQICGQLATGRMMWLGSRKHGKDDREVEVCDACRSLVETQNMLEQAQRDGTLGDLLGF